MGEDSRRAPRGRCGSRALDWATGAVHRPCAPQWLASDRHDDSADFEARRLLSRPRRTTWRRRSRSEDLLYDSKDLVTHAVCVGMTGSGKTGLCLALLEEAAIDGIPALLIDPKGDLGNLLLTFPDLQAGGLPAVDQRGRRAAQGALRGRLRATAGASSGRRASRSGARTARASDALARPPTSPSSRRAARRAAPSPILAVLRGAAAGDRDDAELLRDRVAATATSLLASPRHRRRPDPEPRAHPDLDDPRHRLDRRATTSICRRSSSGSGRRRSRRVGVLDLESLLSVEGAVRARDGAQQPARGARLRRRG